MMTQKADLSLLYETLLTIPGMNDSIKIDLKLPRKSVLLLSKIIERGMLPKGEEPDIIFIMDIVPQDTQEELNELSRDLLLKAGLSEMNEKLCAFRQ